MFVESPKTGILIPVSADGGGSSSGGASSAIDQGTEEDEEEVSAHTFQVRVQYHYMTVSVFVSVWVLVRVHVQATPLLSDSWESGGGKALLAQQSAVVSNMALQFVYLFFQVLNLSIYIYIYLSPIYIYS